jgi:putative glutamine amidotransferase
MDSIGGLNYAEAISKLGGIPLFVPNLAADLAQDYLSHCDGLLLSGGADFDPALFAQDPHPDLGMVEESRDQFELALYHAAKAKSLPILGICRGIQAINIAEGGSLHQHLPALGHKLQHNQKNLDGSLSHLVKLEPSSHLAASFGKETVRTNSYHHQAIDKLGNALKAVAWTSDGIIEAVEGTAHNFVLGVQWHPEMSFERYPEHLAPFSLFMNAVKNPQTHSLPKLAYV